MKNKQTAVEFLEEEIKKFNTVITKEYLLMIINKAKEIEKKQILLSIIILSFFYGYSQKDTTFCRNLTEEREVVKVFMQKDLLDTMYSDCKKENNLLKDAIEHQAKVIVEQGQIIAKTESIVTEKDTQIEAYKSDLKAEKKKTRKAQVKNVGLGAGLGLSAVLNVIMVVKIVGSKL